MHVADVVVLVAAVLASVGAVVALIAAWVLMGQVRRLERGIEALRHEAVPLVHEARVAAGHAASEIARVDAVLADTESVTAAVDHASRLVRRAFANPVVKVLAWRAGAVGGYRRLRQLGPAPVLDVPLAASERGRSEPAPAGIPATTPSAPTAPGPTVPTQTPTPAPTRRRRALRRRGGTARFGSRSGSRSG